ncbi:MAG: biotin/lipoyl-binding protein [Bacteroidales bacterium]|nr:biotin/lipoyl-binding protein [Bacteroidales bacterium]MBR5862555.1 biotin/lipoyl-binding protein [Bacteroidales bacterium]
MNEKKYTINGKEYNVAINSYTGSYAEVTVNGTVYQVKIEDASSEAQPAPSVRPYEAPVVEVQPQTVPAPVPSGNARPVNAPLPGVIIGVKVKVGDVVKEGQAVAILEAMKMENEIQAEFDGTVVSVDVAEGDSVLEGAPIVTIA